MTTFESESVEVGRACEEVFSFLSDFRNFEELMPEQIINWNADQDSCSFTIKGMADLSMRIASKNPCSNIHIVSDGKNPVDYTLDYFLSKASDESCKISIVFDADLNPFMKMMAGRPLQNFVNMMGEKLQEIFPKN